MIFNSTGPKNSSTEFFNQSNDSTKNYYNVQMQSSSFSGSSFKKEKLMQSNDKLEGGIFEYNSQRHTPTIIFPTSNRGTNSPSTPSTSNSRRKLFPSNDGDDTMCETPKTPPKIVRNTSRFMTTSIKKERKHSDKDFSDIETETTEKKKPKLKYYGDSPSEIIVQDKSDETNNRLVHDFEVKEVLKAYKIDYLGSWKRKLWKSLQMCSKTRWNGICYQRNVQKIYWKEQESCLKRNSSSGFFDSY
jgi:hypothetical protein